MPSFKYLEADRDDERSKVHSFCDEKILPQRPASLFCRDPLADFLVAGNSQEDVSNDLENHVPRI